MACAMYGRGIPGSNIDVFVSDIDMLDSDIDSRGLHKALARYCDLQDTGIPGLAKFMIG